MKKSEKLENFDIKVQLRKSKVQPFLKILPKICHFFYIIYQTPLLFLSNYKTHAQKIYTF